MKKENKVKTKKTNGKLDAFILQIVYGYMTASGASGEVFIGTHGATANTVPIDNLELKKYTYTYYSKHYSVRINYENIWAPALKVEWFKDDYRGAEKPTKTWTSSMNVKDGKKLLPMVAEILDKWESDMRSVDIAGVEPKFIFGEINSTLKEYAERIYVD